MLNRTVSVGVRVEGVGDDSSKRGGIIWYWGPRVRPPSGSDAEDYEWIGGHGKDQGLVRAPRAAGVSVDIFEAELRTSPHDFELHADSLALGKFYSRQIASSIWLDSALDKTSAPSFNTSPTAPVVFVGDEAIKIAGQFASPINKSGPTEYKTGGDREAYLLEGRNITSGFLLGGDGQGGSYSHMHRVPEDGGAILWSLTTGAPMRATSNRLHGIVVDSTGTYAYIAVESDGSVGSLGDVILVRVVMATGAIDYSAILDTPTAGGGGSSISVVLDETNDRVYVDTGDTADEVKIAVASTGVQQAQTLDDSGLISSGLARVQISPNDDFIVAMGDGEFIAQWEVSSIVSEGQRFDGHVADRVNVAGVDTTLDFEIQRLDFHGDLKRARDGSNHLIFCGGHDNQVNPFIGKYDPEEPVVANRVIAEVDISTFPGHSAAESVASIAVDKFGRIYALYNEGNANADSGIVRLNPDLTHDDTWDGSSLTLPRSIGSGGTGELATRIAVNESGTIGVTDRDGFLWTYGQTEIGSSGIERGFWGTYAQDHAEFSRVYELNPHHLHRQATVFEYDHADGSVTPKWRGFVNSDIETSDDGTKLILKCVELQAAIAGAVMNKGAPRANLGRSDPALSQLLVGADDPGIVGNRAVGVVVPSEVRVRSKDALSGSTHWGAFQMAGALVYAKYSVAQGVYELIDDEVHSLTQPQVGSAPQLGSKFVEDDIVPIYELFAVDRLRDVEDGVLTGLGNRRSSTAQLEDPFNFLRIIMALLQSSEAETISGNDVLGPDFGLGLPDGLFDLADINQTIARTGLAQIDHLVLGYDGDDVNTWREVKSLCRTYGGFPSRSATGLMTFRTIRTANICDFANAPGLVAIPDTLVFKQARADSVAFLSGRFNILPWSDGRPYRSIVLDTNNSNGPVPRLSRRRGLFAQRREQQFDMPTRADIGELASDLLGVAKAKANQSPRLTLRVLDVGFALGDFVRLSDLNVEEAWLPLPDGTTTLLDPTDVRWVGMVVGLNPDYERGRTQLTMLLTNYASGKAPRTRAPSAEVDSAVGSTYTCTNAVFTSGDDTIEFNIGDVVELWQPDLALRSGTPAAPDTVTITDLSAPKGTALANTIVTDVAFATPPSQYDVIRLAHLDDVDGYPEEGLIEPCDGFLAYAYIATTAGELGPNALEAHIYGGGGGT